MKKILQSLFHKASLKKLSESATTQWSHNIEIDFKGLVLPLIWSIFAMLGESKRGRTLKHRPVNFHYPTATTAEKLFCNNAFTIAWPMAFHWRRQWAAIVGPKNEQSINNANIFELFSLVWSNLCNGQYKANCRCSTLCPNNNFSKAHWSL